MTELIALIRTANDSNSPSFQDVQQQIIERTEADPISFIVDLVHCLNLQTEITQQDIFLLLTMITNCFRKTIETHFDTNTPVSSVNTEMASHLLMHSIEFFSHEYEQVRTAAVNLFVTIIEVDCILIPELHLIHVLTEKLKSENVQDILSATECIAKIADNFVIDQATRLQIFEVCTSLFVNYSSNVDIIKHVIMIFIGMSSSIFQFFDENDANIFIENVLQQFGNETLRPIIYQFIYSIATDNGLAIMPYLMQILEQSISDLTSDTTDAIKLAAAFCWENLFDEDVEFTDDPDVLTTVIVAIAPALIELMRQPPKGDPSLTEWEPYSAAFSALRAIETKSYLLCPVVLQSILCQQVEAESDDEVDNIVSAKCLLLLTERIRDFPESYDDLLQAMGTFIQSSSIHVVFYTLNALSVIIYESDTWEPFSSFLPLLLDFCVEDIIGITALECIFGILMKTDFNQYDVYETLQNMVNYVPPDNLIPLIRCFTNSVSAHVPEEVAFHNLQFLFSSMPLFDIDTQDFICYCIKPILHRGLQSFKDLFPEAYDLLLNQFAEGVFQALPTISAFVFVSPNLFDDILSSFLEKISESLQPDKSFDLWIQAANAWSFLFGRVDMGDFNQTIIEEIVDKAQPDAPLPLQETALKSLNYIFCKLRTEIEATPINCVLSHYIDKGSIGNIFIRDKDIFEEIINQVLLLTLKMAKANAFQLTAAVTSSILSIEITHRFAGHLFLQIAEVFDTPAAQSTVNACEVSQRIHEIFDQPNGTEEEI